LPFADAVTWELALPRPFPFEFALSEGAPAAVNASITLPIHSEYRIRFIVFLSLSLSIFDRRAGELFNIIDSSRLKWAMTRPAMCPPS
jgi:hypothetical protein